MLRIIRFFHWATFTQVDSKHDVMIGEIIFLGKLATFTYRFGLPGMKNTIYLELAQLECASLMVDNCDLTMFICYLYSIEISTLIEVILFSTIIYLKCFTAQCPFARLYAQASLTSSIFTGKNEDYLHCLVSSDNLALPDTNILNAKLRIFQPFLMTRS